MGYIERRQKDDANDKKISRVIDKYVYGTDEFSETGRTWEYTKQIKGIDTWFTLSGVSYVCDEKTATYYMGKRLDTFALEISSYSPIKHVRYGGWFMEDGDNNSYLFVYINKCDGTVDNFTSGDVKQIEVILVRKEALVGYLNGIGYTYDRLKHINYDIVYNHVRGWEFDDRENNIRFHYGWKTSEKSVNLLLPKTILRELSDYNEVIDTQDEQG